MKKITYSFIILLLASSFLPAYQGDPVSQFRWSIDAFNKTYHRNKLDLVFNQPKYSPGDTALVRTLYLKATDLQPVQGRQIVYIDLFNRRGSKVYQNQILVANGFASNALIIPQNLSPGIYLLVAYSD